jgi:hypothetical protein
VWPQWSNPSGGHRQRRQPQWKALADTLRSLARTMQTLQAQTMQGGMPERLARQGHLLAVGVDAVKAVEGPARARYVALSPDQQKKASELMGRAMGGRRP